MQLVVGGWMVWFIRLSSTATASVQIAEFFNRLNMKLDLSNLKSSVSIVNVIFLKEIKEIKEIKRIASQ